MPYSDLYADADLYFSFNNTPNYTTTANLKSTSFSTAWTYVNDAPAGIETTHSARANGYASSPINYVFDGFPMGANNARSYSTWIKIVPNTTLVSGTTNLGTSSLTLFINDPSSGASDDDRLQINFGTYNNTVSGGADRYLQLYSYESTVSTGTASRISVFSNRKMPFNEWVHIAYVVKSHPTLNSIEKAIYVNGVCWYWSPTTNKSLLNLKWISGNPIVGGVTVPNFITTTNPNVNIYQSHTGFWNRELTKAQIRQQAWYGHSNEDYNALILSDNPTCYMDFDNTVKGAAHSVYGENWEYFDSTPSAFNVNQNAFANKKGWTNVLDTGPNMSNNLIRNWGTTINTRLGQLIRSGEYSVEFWYKISDKPSSTRNLFSTDVSTALYKNGHFAMRVESTGQLDARQSYKSGATTYIVGSVAPTTIGASTVSDYSLHPGGGSAKNWADGEWHHFVYTLSISDGASWNGTAGVYRSVLYADGARLGDRTWTNTSGWLDGTDPIQFIDISAAQNTSTLRDISVAAFAVYPRRLTEKEIEEHFIAGQDFISDYGVVKYYNGTSWVNATATKTWNGTAWIDWSKKYYDGSQWVTI